MAEKVGLEMRYFTLKPRGTDAYACASRAAMATYANFIEDENPRLAAELVQWLNIEWDRTRLGD